MRQEQLVVKVSKERIRDKHVPEKLPQLVSGINTLLLDGLQNGGQLFSITILLTVNAGVFQMGKLDEPFPTIREIPTGNYWLCFAAVVRIISEERFLRPKAQYFKDMTGDIFADTAVAVTHIPVPAGLWRKLEHIAVSLIGDIDFIPVGSAIGAEAVDRAVGKINHRFSPLINILHGDNLPAPV